MQGIEKKLNQHKPKRSTMKTAYITRTEARNARTIINAKAFEAGSRAMLRQPVKDSDNLWIFPGLNHGKKLTLKGK